MSDVETIEGQVVEEVGQALEVAGAAPPAGLFRTEDPAEIVAKATAVATTLSAVLKKQKLTTAIGKSEHVRVEGWTLLGSMLGVVAITEWTRPLHNPDGWEARVVAKTLSGVIVGAAEAECLRSEKEWGPNPTRGKPRDDYALRSMAQTRATSKALRQPLGFVVSLAGFNPTPAEEMPREGYDDGPYGSGEPTSSGTADQPASATIRPNQPPRAAGSWTAIKKQITEYGESVWSDWWEFVKQARQYIFPDVAKLSKEQDKELMSVTAKAALWLAEHFAPGEFPPPTRQNLIDAWVSVLEVELAGPDWRMGPDEPDREPKEAE